jgi:phospholipase/carboxylesterase
MAAAPADPHRDQPVRHSGEPLESAIGAVILLHGRGGSAEDILSLEQPLYRPRLAYLAPQAANNTWYPNSFLAPIAQNQPWLDSALRKVEATVEDVAAAGISTERILLGGFSQGACLATEFVASHPRRYAGLIALTGGLIGPPGMDLTHTGSLAGTPAFFGSGDPDPHHHSRGARLRPPPSARRLPLTLIRHLCALRNPSLLSSTIRTI